MKNVLIVGGGPITLSQLQHELLKKPELIIAADRGGSYLAELAVLPEVLIGDFDSLPQKTLQQLVEAGVEVKSFAVTKDYTDLELAVDLALAKDATRINILGGLGGRIDHTLANIGLLLKALERGVEAHLIDLLHDIMVTKDQVILKRKPGWAVSLVPLSLKVLGVTTTGLTYKLDKEDLLLQSSRGIHNEFTEETATVELIQGVLMVITFKEDY
jgi:thiamine pyrophosphokinase